MHWCLFIQYDNRKFFQTMYGHLATDDSAGELRQVRLILEEMIKMTNWWYQVYQDITNNKTLRIANWWYQVYIYTKITIKLTFPSSSARVNFPVQFGLDFTSRDPRHSSRGRKEMTTPLPNACSPPLQIKIMSITICNPQERLWLVGRVSISRSWLGRICGGIWGDNLDYCLIII